jgi:general secretion pathway protein C
MAAVVVKKYFFALALAAIALGALLAAKTVNRIIEARLFLDGSQAVLPVPGRPARRAPPKPAAPGRTDVNAILQRNIFCSDCPPILPQPEVEAAPTSDEPVRTTLGVQLVATMVSDDPAWSFAAIRDTTLSHTGLYGVGSQLLPGMPGIEVTAIESKRVFLANGGRPEYVDLEGLSDAAPPNAAAPATSSKDPLAKDIDAGVRKTSENRYEVDRSLIEKILGAPQALAKAARIVPSVKDGQPNGFKIYAVRAGSPYSKIGLMNGDTIHAINGHEITTPDKALEVYSKVRNATHITVGLTRRSQPLTLDYSIR